MCQHRNPDLALRFCSKLLGIGLLSVPYVIKLTSGAKLTNGRLLAQDEWGRGRLYRGVDHLPDPHLVHGRYPDRLLTPRRLWVMPNSARLKRHKTHLDPNNTFRALKHMYNIISSTNWQLKRFQREKGFKSGRVGLARSPFVTRTIPRSTAHAASSLGKAELKVFARHKTLLEP